MKKKTNQKPKRNYKTKEKKEKRRNQGKRKSESGGKSIVNDSCLWGVVCTQSESCQVPLEGKERGSYLKVYCFDFENVKFVIRSR